MNIKNYFTYKTELHKQTETEQKLKLLNNYFHFANVQKAISFVRNVMIKKPNWYKTANNHEISVIFLNHIKIILKK